jgi:hypothetical protein
MAELGWREAILQVLKESGDPMHYPEIAEAITAKGLRSQVGATPAATVNSLISTSLANEGPISPFVRVARGYYALKAAPGAMQAVTQESDEHEDDETGLINALGMYWARDDVLWTAKPRLLGQQQEGSTTVDFCAQQGVYLLHDGRAVVYVGRTTEQPLGVRLKQQTTGRLSGRWDRFSWFGVHAVDENGHLEAVSGNAFSLNSLIATMEALLIEGLEPPQNRKRGDDFKAVEFQQVEDPEIQKTQIIRLMDELKKKL